MADHLDDPWIRLILSRAAAYEKAHVRDSHYFLPDHGDVLCDDCFYELEAAGKLPPNYEPRREDASGNHDNLPTCCCDTDDFRKLAGTGSRAVGCGHYVRGYFTEWGAREELRHYNYYGFDPPSDSMCYSWASMETAFTRDSDEMRRLLAVVARQREDPERKKPVAMILRNYDSKTDYDVILDAIRESGTDHLIAVRDAFDGACIRWPYDTDSPEQLPDREQLGTVAADIERAALEPVFMAHDHNDRPVYGPATREKCFQWIDAELFASPLNQRVRFHGYRVRGVKRSFAVIVASGWDPTVILTKSVFVFDRESEAIDFAAAECVRLANMNNPHSNSFSEELKRLQTKKFRDEIACVGFECDPTWHWTVLVEQATPAFIDRAIYPEKH